MSNAERAERMAKTVGATALLLFVLLIFPYQFVTRFAEGMGGGFQASDIGLVCGVYAWIVAAAALLEREATPAKSKIVPWHLHVFMSDLVEVSAFGVGAWGKAFTVHNPAVNTAWLTAPTLDPAMLGPETNRSRQHAAIDAAGPDLDADDLVVLRRRQKKQSILAGIETTTYEVQRGDTWWSMSEKFISDGRKWKDLLEINIGHEPAPDVVIDDRVNSTPLIGWKVLVPAEIIKPEEDEEEPQLLSSSLLEAARDALS